MKKFSHIDEHGKANMVDVSHKPSQNRVAIAKGCIRLSAETRSQIAQNNMKKGDVLSVAQIAGIQAAKQTANLIPLCHTLLLSKVDLNLELVDEGVEARCLVKSQGQTGVEMEALTGVSVALLTVYDMCKAIDKDMELGQIRLIEKTKTDLV